MNDCQCLRMQRRRSLRRQCPLQRSLATAARERTPTPPRLLPPTATSNKNHPPTAALLLPPASRRHISLLARLWGKKDHGIRPRCRSQQSQRARFERVAPGYTIQSPFHYCSSLLLPFPNRLARRTSTNPGPSST